MILRPDIGRKEGLTVDEPGRFLAGIAAVVRREDDGRFLLLKRAGTKDFGAGVWECVTGRVNQGEGFEQAILREVREETRLDVRIDYLVGSSHFHRGDRRPENELLGLVCCCSTGTPEAFVLGPEHSEHRWVTLDEAPGLLTAEDAGTRWIRDVLMRLRTLEEHVPEEVRAHFRALGIETG